MNAFTPFDFSAPSLQPEIAQLMAHAAEAAYLPPDEICHALTACWGEIQLAFFDEEETQAFVASNASATVIAFRGTEPSKIQDWFTDADIAMVKGPLEGRVHVGFYDALSHVWRQVEQCVEHFDEGSRKPLWLTGHSLGGALATLAAARWVESGRPPHGLYTFGQPRVGDRDFARNFNFSLRPFTFRFVNHNDLVTRLPPRACGYRHLGTFRYFMEDGRFAEDANWWRLFLDRWQGRVADALQGIVDDLDDHSMTEYRRRIEQSFPVKPRIYRPLEDERLVVRPRRRIA